MPLLIQDPGKVIDGAKEFGPNMYLVVLVFVASAFLVWSVLRWLKTRDEKEQAARAVRDEREQGRMDRIVTHMEEQGRVSIEQSKAIVGIGDHLKTLDDEILVRRRKNRKGA
jgi:membrane protein implicated in regulation of membrane protease activity